jgi:hypothetical protein
MVGSNIFDVECSESEDPGLPSIYAVDLENGLKVILSSPLRGDHKDVLLAALDYLEANNELSDDLATTPVNQIMEI